MNEAAILEKLQPIFRDVLDNDRLTIKRSDSAETIEGWDSLTYVVLATSIEKDFGIRFVLGELQDLENIGEMVDLMATKLKAGLLA
jgi:acyl carrier protein